MFAVIGISCPCTIGPEHAILLSVNELARALTFRIHGGARGGGVPEASDAGERG